MSDQENTSNQSRTQNFINNLLNMDSIKVIQIGAGSMGRRRIRNLKHIGINNIDCYDIRNERAIHVAGMYGVNPIREFDDIDWQGYTHLIISTPPDVHMQYAKIGIKNSLNTFIEASVTNEDVSDVIDLYNRKEKKFLVAPSCTMRFDPIIIQTKEILESNQFGKVLNVNHYFGQYLPDWHPYEGIRDFYVSNRQTGAAREIVAFDLVYLTWLFGELSRFNGFTINTGILGVDIDDIYSFNAITSRKIALQVTIEVLARKSIRETRVICEKGYMLIDNVKGVLEVFDSSSKSWRYFERPQLSSTFSSEEMYVRELKCFIDSTLGKEVFPYTLEEDLRVLNTLVSVESNCLRIS